MKLLDGHDTPLSAEAHRKLGLGLLGLGQLDQAYHELERSLILYEKLSNPYHIATVHQELGVCCMRWATRRAQTSIICA